MFVMDYSGSSVGDGFEWRKLKIVRPIMILCRNAGETPAKAMTEEMERKGTKGKNLGKVYVGLDSRAQRKERWQKTRQFLY